MTYKAPLTDIRFALEEIAAIDELKAEGGFADLSADLIEAVLNEAAKLAENVIAPTNWPGDQFGAKLADGVVTAAPGFGEAYKLFTEAGWQSLSADPAFGGQGLPRALALAVNEMVQSANMSFSLGPMLTLGAIEALHAFGTDAQKATYLPKLVSGEWSGTMNLTEPQAGSDLGLLKTQAIPQPDGSYRLKGQKIYITWGEHELSKNIIHLVLARVPDAPPGSRGISLFVVPKYLPDAAGNPGVRNDLKCIGLEHKLGIHASPTCTMAFGEKDGAIGWLVGEVNKGLAHMFTMMNAARLYVGLQGVAVAEAAFQRALAYAQARLQGKADGDEHGPSPIFNHPDIRRTLVLMKAKIQAGRALCYETAVCADGAMVAEEPADKQDWKWREELLTPIAKAWCTELGCSATSEALQIHGGMGYIEETGIAQLFRDARIAPIYEGTNGIQAIDLIARKLPMSDAGPIKRLIEDIAASVEDCTTSSNLEVVAIGERLKAGLAILHEATGIMLAAKRADSLSGAQTFLTLAGDVIGGWLLAKGALAAQRHIKNQEGDLDYWHSRINLARVYADDHLAQIAAALPRLSVPASRYFAHSAETLMG